MTYEPDPRNFLQLSDPLTGRFDCTAWSYAEATAATSSGAIAITGHEVRMASNEKAPDPKSPGLNLEQGRDAVLALTDGHVRFDVRDPMPVADAQARIAAGEWAVVQIDRGVLVQRGIVRGFAGPHAVTAHKSGDALRMGDPLLPAYVELGWDDLWAAAQAFASHGTARVALVPGPKPATRYRVRITGGHDRPTWLYASRDTGSARSGPIYSATVTATRVREGSGWWYRIAAAPVPSWVGKWFQAEPWMDKEALP